MDYTKESIKKIYTRHVVVGLSEVAVDQIGFEFEKGITLRAPGTGDPTPNTAPIWVGPKGVTADSDTETGGMPILPGESRDIPLEDATGLYAISTAATQDLAWMGA